MIRRLLAVFALAIPSVVVAQSGVGPSPIRVGASSGGSSTITAGVTATSGCVAGGVLRSISNLVQCGAGLTYDGTTFGITGVVSVGSATARPTVAAYSSGDGTGYSLFSFGANNMGGGLIMFRESAAGTTFGISNAGKVALYYGDTSARGMMIGMQTAYPLYFATNDIVRMNIDSAGTTTIGSSSLGTTVVPLTVTPGTGNTVNILNVTNSASTPVWSIGKAGTPVYASGIPAVSNTSANSCGTTAATIAGTAETGIITVGATSGTSCTVTFAVAAPTRRQCVVNNETTTTNIVQSTYSSTTVSIFAGTFVAGDVLAYICQVY